MHLTHHTREIFESSRPFVVSDSRHCDCRSLFPENSVNCVRQAPMKPVSIKEDAALVVCGREEREAWWVYGCKKNVLEALERLGVSYVIFGN